MKLYHPVVEFVLEHKWKTIAAAVIAMVLTVPVFFKLGSEFMPPLDEGTLLYMPTTLPGMSVTEASRLLQVQDKIIKSFPEVDRVFGKAGRVESATDPAPYSMMETVITLKPQAEWPKRDRWYSKWAPNWLQGTLGRFWPDHKTTQELIYGPGGLNDALTMPGISNAWTMPIKARIDMLTTGVRTPLGIKVLGSDLSEIEKVGGQIEMALKDIPGTTSVFAERTTGGYFLDFDLKRDQLARYGLTVDDANDVLMSAVGGEPVTTTIEGRERYSVNVRYLRDYRSDIDALQRVLVNTPSGAQIPLGQIADISLKTGPGMIRDENGRLSGYVYVDVSGRDIGSYVDGREEDRGGKSQRARRVSAGVERAVRIDGARKRAPEDRGADHAFHRLPVAVLQHQVHGEDFHHPPRCAVLSDWRDLVPLPPELQHEYCGVGRADRAARSRCGNSRLHAAVPRSRVSRRHQQGTNEHLG